MDAPRFLGANNNLKGDLTMPFVQRSLTKSQKELLNRAPTIALSVDDIPGLLQELEKINDYETLWQDANRFLSDRYFAAQRERSAW
jgi:hypothetical protein